MHSIIIGLEDYRHEKNTLVSVLEGHNLRWRLSQIWGSLLIVTKAECSLQKSIGKRKRKKNNTIISTKNYLQNNQIFNINIKAWFVSLLHKGGSHPRQSRYMLCDLRASLEICLTEEVEGNATQNQALTSTVCQVFLLFSCVFLSFDNQELRMN